MVGNLMSGMDPKMVKMAMKKLGIKQEDIGASRVIIETLDNKKIIINHPAIQKIDMAGNVSFQISGEISEEKFSDEDINIVVEQTGASKDKAKRSLEKNNGDLAKTILELKEE
ncbi:nascent polypeptide-associated complex protein [Candidatus Woesearchaeota archaeon]|nr:nascent polypeptide-associated complex protein [Candidatus Woesearchaeota archaeon]